MTKKHSITICAFLAVTGAESLPAQTLERACTSATSQYYDAFAAGDHNAAERLTHERLKTCKAAGFPDFFLSQIYGDLAGILNSEHRWSEALRAADAGIANYYTSPACHYERRQSLIMLRKKAEADKERQTLLVVSKFVMDRQAGPSSHPLYEDWLAEAKSLASSVLKVWGPAASTAH